MISIRKHAVVGLALVLGLCVGAGTARADALYWAVERDGETAGYLLGTVHSEDPRVLDYTESFLDTLGSCETFAMELVPDLPTMAELTRTMQLPEGQDLAAMLGQQRFEQVTAALAGYGVPEFAARRLKPWAVMMMLSMPPPRSGLFMDFSLSLRAAGAGLDVVGLETLEQQLAFMEELTVEAQIEMLDQAVAEVDRVAEIHTGLVDTYLEGSMASLLAESDEQMATLSAETQAYFQAEGIDRRNERMVNNAVPLLREGCTFIAVGALHLPGETGLVQGLGRAGFELKPLALPLNGLDEASEIRP
ncbi:TraB/GumN family protein [Marinihelvus fidelis]|uniref:TraB/GumN family protein n=1 Tax=Marinihelvus fidelis TaxID=2613842 RepID=A0A5N0TDG3_9GAMM|nr:TraB/GumN family protein [Marinihelvus fidelis]KAA9132504.1 TraB/GumN family protein [Marinihelvus fidelis]